MRTAPVMAELWRAGRRESIHRGHAVIVDAGGQVIEAWGDPSQLIYPRSSCKMLQGLPLLETGAADALGLGSEELALACASHSGGHIHTNKVSAWLERLGLSEADLRCGAHVPSDKAARKDMRDSGDSPCQIHNNCSGKHAGFLTAATRLGGDADYIDPDHPVQKAALEAFEAMTDETSPGFGIDGCSAPNHVCTLTGLAKAMAKFTVPEALGKARGKAVTQLYQAMATHPDLIAGHGRACTELGHAMKGRGIVKTGAEGVYVAIAKEKKLGIALKIEDGTTRASEAAIAALLVRIGMLERDDPAVQARINAPERNWRKMHVGDLVTAETLFTGSV